MKTLRTIHGGLALPAFMPDGTRAAVRTLDSADLAGCGVQSLMVNILHLSNHPGTGAVTAAGGIHRFMGWPNVIACDSGGFQALSLVTGSRSLGKVTADGFTYRFDPKQRKRTLTPEDCIRRQFEIGADVMFCLDYCTHPGADRERQRESVDLTVAWARRCREEFNRAVEARATDGQRPLLFAVVQGGNEKDLRKECAERLAAIGFDGYGYGGWPIGDAGELIDMVAYVADLLPRDAPKHGLGIGKPENVVAAYRMGYATFDCVLPTRDARHKRLYVFKEGYPDSVRGAADFYEHLYLQDERYVRDARPLEEGCDCLCCSRYSRAYLSHLFQINEQLANRLATIHNLRFYARLMDALRAVEAPHG